MGMASTPAYWPNKKYRSSLQTVSQLFLPHSNCLNRQATQATQRTANSFPGSSLYLEKREDPGKEVEKMDVTDVTGGSTDDLNLKRFGDTDVILSNLPRDIKLLRK